MRDSVVFVIENFIEIAGDPFIVGRKFLTLQNLYPDPFDSIQFDIFKCSDVSGILCVPCDSLLFKVYLIPLYGIDAYAAFLLENY